MMGNRLLIVICVRSGLWDEWRGLFCGFHPSVHDEAPSKVNAFKPSSSQISNLQLHESFPRWWRANAQGGCLAETACGAIEMTFPTDGISTRGAVINAHRRRFHEGLNPHNPCFQPEPSFLTTRQILR
jgi:hypothetical protein